MSELLQPMPEKLRDYQPQQRYLLIDEGRYSAAELEKLDNVTAALIRDELAERVKTWTKPWWEEGFRKGLRKELDKVRQLFLRNC